MQQRFSIQNKILLVFSVVIVFFTGNAFLNHYYLNKTGFSGTLQSEMREASHQIPRLKQLLENSGKYVSSWVLWDMEHNDKFLLKKLQREEYPQLKKQLRNNAAQWTHKSRKDSLFYILNTFDEIIERQQLIMLSLSKPGDYTHPQKRNSAGQMAEDINEDINVLSDKLERIYPSIREDAIRAEQELNQNFGRLRFSATIIGIIGICVGIVAAFVLSRSISRPVQALKKAIHELSKGRLPDQNPEITNDEFGEMISEVNTLIVGLKKVSDFSENIGNGNLASEFSPLSNEDVLGNSLLRMRANLQQVAQEDEYRNWSNEGLAHFAEVLRNGDHLSLKDLSDKIIGSLVKYLRLNQGWMYVLEYENDHRDDAAYLDLKSCYAFNRKKFVSGKIYMGQGLTGQCWQEGEAIYMNDVPEDYVTIQSGTGAANPTCILIMPLKVNNEIYGMLEVAGFRNLEKYEIDFVERVAEIIASTISVTKINDRTRVLLENSQSLTENLRMQEEEMRQNLEELHSTQEEMNRREEKLRVKIKALEEALRRSSETC